MGSILPHAINNGGSAPVSTTSQQPRIGPFGIGDLLQTAGDVMVQLGGSNEAVARLAARRVQEQQQDIERQRYAASLQQQRFMNSLASHRDRLADQEYQLRRAALSNRTGGGDGGDFSKFVDSPQAQGPTSSMLSQIQGSSAIPIPTPAVSPVTNEHAPQIPAVPVVAVNNNYVKPPIIDLAKFSPELRAKFEGLKANNPDMYDQVINVANYGVPERDVLKGIKNPRDRLGFARAVRAANPAFDEGRAAFRANIVKDLANPKTELGKLPEVTDLVGQGHVLDAAYKNLPDWYNRSLNKYLVRPVSHFFNSAPYADVDAKRGAFVRGLERTLSGGKPTQASINQATGSLPDDEGYATPHKVIRGYENALIGKWVASINNVHVASSRLRGIPSDLVPENILDQLKQRRFVVVKNGYVIPQITAQQYEDRFKENN